MEPVLICGQWQASHGSESFQATDPQTGQSLAAQFPVSTWSDLEAALAAAAAAFEVSRELPGARIAEFLEAYADGLEAQSDVLRQVAHQETALPLETRLVGELARTTGQLRQAAAAARVASWRRPVIDTANGIRSCLAPLGPVAVFGPNNFPLAFGSISGGDFAAALAAGNPVIGKANPMHPQTTQRLAEVAQAAAQQTGMPAGMVQLVYHMDYADGERMIRDPRLAAVGFTGSRAGGLALKRVADEVGKPIYLELSSVNPIVMLPGALEQRGAELAQELTGSCLLGTGQFCTNPGLILLLAGEPAEALITATAEQMQEAPVGPLFSASGRQGLAAAIGVLTGAGATIVCGGQPADGPGFRHANTVLRISGEGFLQQASTLQTEAFGPATLFVTAESLEQLEEILDALEGNLTGCIYSHTEGADDAAYDRLVPRLRQKVGRLINDRMPTGVAVSPAMNHGGPFPATGHPGFTAVGIPAAITRYAMLQCFDNVRPHRLPDVLQDANPLGCWRSVDGEWTREPLVGSPGGSH